MTPFNIDYTLNDYLSNCDLINKYNFLTTNEIFNCKFIKISFLLKNFKNNLNFSRKDIDTNTQSFFFFFFLFSMFPQIKLLTKKNIVDKEELNLYITIKNKHEKNIFLTYFFEEIWKTLPKKKYILKKKYKTILFTNISLENIKDFDFLFDTEDYCFVSKEFTIRFEFHFTKFTKNVPLFWLNG